MTKPVTTWPVMGLADAPVHTGAHGAQFAYSLRSLAEPLGAQAIGVNITTVPPGDYIVNLPGNAELAHQLINISDEDLVYADANKHRVGYWDGEDGTHVAGVVQEFR